MKKTKDLSISQLLPISLNKQHNQSDKKENDRMSIETQNQKKRIEVMLTISL